MPPPTHLATVAVIVVLAGLTACAGSDERSANSDPVRTMTTTEATPSDMTTPGEGTNPDTTTLGEATADTSVSTPSGGAPESTASTSPPDSTTPTGSLAVGDDEFPGGSADHDVLGGWLSPEALLVFGEAAPGSDVQAAICEYLVGNPSDVGAAAGLTGDVTLEETAGYTVLGSNGVGFQCGYEVDGTFAFGLVVWSEDLTEQIGDQTNTVIVDLHDGLSGATVYDPDWTGTQIDRSTSERWITEAGSRVHAG